MACTRIRRIRPDPPRAVQRNARSLRKGPGREHGLMAGADTITAPDVSPGDGTSGGAGRGGSSTAAQGPLVVVQQPRAAAPPRPAPRPKQSRADTTLRNGYAAIAHSVSGETAAIGLGFLVGGPVGAVIGGAVGPAALAALMWRGRNAEHDANSNTADPGRGSTDRSGSHGGTNGTGRGGRGDVGGQGRNNGSGAGRHKDSTGGSGNGASGAGGRRKPKDPVLDKLGKSLSKLKPDKSGSPKGLGGKAGGGPGGKPGQRSNGSSSKTSPDKAKKTRKGADDESWTSSPHGLDPRKPKSSKGQQKWSRKKKGSGGDVSSSTARDGLDPKGPKGDGGAGIVDGELVDDDLPPKPGRAPDPVVDGEVVDEDRIALVRAKREKTLRRAAIKAGRKAAERAARDGNLGDPHQVKTEVIREANQRIDLEIHHDNQRLALTAAAETPRSTPVNYPAIQAAPAGTRTAGVAVARQVDFRGSTAYAILRAMADQLANGLHSDDDADMGDHIVELTGIPNMCKNLSVAVQEAGRALARTAPLHPSVIKHLDAAAVAARTAGLMADQIMTVFVQAHREDIIRILDPRVGEERWNIRNGPGTLDAAKLRAAIASAHSARLTLPTGAAPSSGTPGGGRLVPASDGSTKQLIGLMKGFTRGHMVNVLSEVAGSAAGVEAVADSVTKLYRRMASTWPTEGVVDETVRATASKVLSVSTELKKAIKAAQRAHQRELRLNAKPRKGARAESKWDPAGRIGGQS
ncbi:hypothetical protein PV725_22725 [Streptomyces scabiei]|nr:hypothetical protein [Streptomyces scabiei]